MDTIVRQITDELIEKLPDSQSYFSPQELEELGFPSFVIDRVQIELERNLAESIIIPTTDWANMNTDNVQQAWQQFVEAIRNEARLPASFARPVFETAADDILDILVEPRANIPEIVFGDDDQLAYEELLERVKQLVVYRHFAQVLPRYMQKKELDSLTKERCAKVIAQVDEKMVRHYSPLNWAQMLEPWFTLMGEKVDSNLLRMFFEDKERPRIARHFDEMDGGVTKATLIESLSSPELLDVDGEDDEMEETEEAASSQQQQTFTTSFSSDRFEEAQEESTDKKQPSGSPNDDAVTDDFDDEMSNIESEPAAETDDEEDDEPLYKQFASEDDDHEDQPDDIADKDVAAEHEQEDEDEDQEEKPMWKRFVRPEEEYEEEQDADEEAVEEPPEDAPSSSDDEVDFEEDEDEEVLTEEDVDEDTNIDEDGFIEEPLIDLTEQEEEDDEEKFKKLMAYLEDDKDYFVDEIFQGDELAFSNAVDEISTFRNWSSAGKYINSEIFRRNMIDIYSEPAVDFTDRLQSYFMEQTKKE